MLPSETPHPMSHPDHPERSYTVVEDEEEDPTEPIVLLDNRPRAVLQTSAGDVRCPVNELSLEHLTATGVFATPGTKVAGTLELPGEPPHTFRGTVEWAGRSGNDRSVTIAFRKLDWEVMIAVARHLAHQEALDEEEALAARVPWGRE